MRTRLHKFGVGLAAIMLTTGGISIATASPAAAVTCGQSAPDRDTDTAQVINRDPTYPTGVAMRTGPSSDCRLIVRVPWSAWVDLNCYRLGEAVHGYPTWSAVHYAQYFGWISDAYLSGNGAGPGCVS